MPKPIESVYLLATNPTLFLLRLSIQCEANDCSPSVLFNWTTTRFTSTRERLNNAVFLIRLGISLQLDTDGTRGRWV
ncbi:MAG: hypothetical protein OEX77_00215 [Candidatus Bathyarchaeota archaeon]|nr:hypothetical protein [Candidatus Bathyarchaeota archaeon]MDH5732236.1 hypothetical protein [Candidatus Bathyarchaeota archaeon]